MAVVVRLSSLVLEEEAAALAEVGAGPLVRLAELLEAEASLKAGALSTDPNFKLPPARLWHCEGRDSRLETPFELFKEPFPNALWKAKLLSPVESLSLDATREEESKTSLLISLSLSAGAASRASPCASLSICRVRRMTACELAMDLKTCASLECTPEPFCSDALPPAKPASEDRRIFGAIAELPSASAAPPSALPPDKAPVRGRERSGECSSSAREDASDAELRFFWPRRSVSREKACKSELRGGSELWLPLVRREEAVNTETLLAPSGKGGKLLERLRGAPRRAGAASSGLGAEGFSDNRAAAFEPARKSAPLRCETTSQGVSNSLTCIGPGVESSAFSEASQTSSCNPPSRASKENLFSPETDAFPSKRCSEARDCESVLLRKGEAASSPKRRRKPTAPPPQRPVVERRPRPLSPKPAATSSAPQEPKRLSSSPRASSPSSERKAESPDTRPRVFAASSVESPPPPPSAMTAQR